ncbi:MAG: 3-deoxy-D-manno-octulosonic acid transferase [Candidatus Omnitrophica bacterium]|nr:3-deoxy-D-manno-octulosonic acid transferase [bacterium]NUN97086.1 3-deoxy-D-manno-octulosonic acid transferase [Candidatus Omnitrophota bacterium]
MWLPLYSVVFSIGFFILLPWVLWTGWRKGKMRGGLSERFGALRRPWVRTLEGRRPIWVHAVSVGEAQMLPPLLQRIREAFPDIPVVVSTNTVTGQAIAQGLAHVHGVFYSPLDFGWAVRKVLGTLNPRLLVILETEIWPNLVVQTTRSGVPVMFLNGRIGDRSFRRYLRLRAFFTWLLRHPAAFGMRSDRDAERIIRMGAPPERVHVLGNLKYESAVQLLEDPCPIRREEFGLAQEDLVLVGGSTFPGEEDLLIRVYTRLRQSHPNLRLMVAPRHPERFEEAARAIRASGHPLAKRSSGPLQRDSQGPAPIVLLDVMGELKRIYRVVDVVFIGKSMGVSPAGCGGQNPLEAAAWSKPVLCGPRMENFEEATQLLIEAGGVDVVRSEEELSSKLEFLLINPDRRKLMGAAAFSTIRTSLGSADRGLELIRKVLMRES